MVPLSAAQAALVARPLDEKIFLSGPAGAGKTTAAAARLRRLLREGVPADQVLVLLPQRTLAGPYEAVLSDPELGPGGVVHVLTLGGLARRAVELFWPLVAEAAGFARPHEPPGFLTLETAQYHMARIVRPLLEAGAFASVTLERGRLYAQLLDDLNKAAVMGFPLEEVGPRLAAAWVGEPGQKRVFQDVQEAIGRFRAYCLENNLLDFSLTVEVFLDRLQSQLLWRAQLGWRYLFVDNAEEDVPVTHELLAEWLPACRGALIVMDSEAGYRTFLGADPEGAAALAERCDARVTFAEHLVQSPAVRALEAGLVAALSPRPLRPAADPRPALRFAVHRFQPEALRWTAAQVVALVREEGVPPGEIAILAPFLSDVLHFALTSRLEEAGIPLRTHRPSRALGEEPGAACLLTLAALAHPAWGPPPSREEVAAAWAEAIEGLDPVRAQLLSETLYRPEQEERLLPFEVLRGEMRARIGHELGERYETLRRWLARRGDPEEAPDRWLSRLFGEVLSQPGFGFRADAARTAANLIDSLRKFRQLAERRPAADGRSLGQEYLDLVREGLVAAQYLRGWEHAEDAVLVAPVSTFLLANRPVEIQFWLNVAEPSWGRRLDQPLTHPYVLSRRWSRERPWTDEDEVRAQRVLLRRWVCGLLRRCRRRVYLPLSELDAGGMEQQGPLLRAFQRLLRALQEEPDV